ncbi:putative AP-2 complex subunit sigma-1 [Cardiosporidium cionae]|uniref:AP complex subunit sigma n=1 Tax=Cardiosporidium cionae TaxID=476202 RepID=A0ABQ7JA29_9APIC|nr:putative AP-2 complex subunit sigma-1 [Cardiosporidium cionae]|eukprot:KAF8820784.1 putative AP-2 complex subunit sigma-1 [Cardiosporidium cionae]
MIQFIFLLNRQGKIRLIKFFSPIPQKERQKIPKEISQIILSRSPKLCNFVEWREYKIVYRRYASLYVALCVDQSDNELLALEMIHHYVELLDKYFGSVCELDLIFNFHKAHFIVDELFLAGEFQESSKAVILNHIAAQEMLMEEGTHL